MYVESFEKLSGNDMFEGFAVDLAHELSLVLGFNYTIKLVDDGKVGSCPFKLLGSQLGSKTWDFFLTHKFQSSSVGRVGCVACCGLWVVVHMHKF